MADEVQYASGGGDSAPNKRKYDDQTSPSPASSGGGGRRTTGFSAPISSQSPPDGAPRAYNNVPPPMDEIQLAKQKAQEIASRLFSNVEAKRPRVENGGGGGFDYSESQKPLPSIAPSVTGSYGYPGPSKKIEIPNTRVGVIIGKGGETIKYLQLQSGAKIQVTRDMDADPNSAFREVELMGTPEQISKAEQLIKEVLSEADAGGSGIVSRRITGLPSGAQQFSMKIPNNKVGLIIGKGGETIKNMQARTGARIQVIPLHLPPGDTSSERTLQIDGSSEQIESAKQLVDEVISENRARNQAMSYPQQGYQARPPTNWGPPGAPMQQPGYGYLQPGAYPGPSPQYNVNQPAYGGYPQQPTSGGYATGWDQSTSQNQQTAPQGGGYDYYGQQQPPQQQQAPGGSGAPPDNSAYAYQAPAYGQGPGYSQDGYGGYHAAGPQAGYSQGQQNPIPGYDQQQGYNSTPGYGNANPTPDGHTPSYGTQSDANQAPPSVQSTMGQQGYHAGQQPTTNPNYPPPGSAQPGYGLPPTSQGGYGTQAAAGYGTGYGQTQGQKPPSTQPSYGQPHQSPSAQGGYGQPAAAQPGYPHTQPPPSQTYAQPDSGAQRPPASYGAPTAQPGYGGPPYGAPPAAQPTYGQQPPYNSAYGAGYAQPPSYSSEGGATTPQTATQSSGATKASPQN